MKERDIAATLLESTVRVIARDGLDKASIRTISADCQVPNPYIYQHFESKDGLWVSAFSQVDLRLVAALTRILSSVHQLTPDIEVRCQMIWLRLWNLMMESKEYTQFYLQYYYSKYFERFSKVEHQERLQPVECLIRNCFVEDANVQVLLQHILDNMMNLAMKAYNGDLSNDADAKPHLYRLTIAPIAPYLNKKNSEPQIEGEICL